ncbi:LysM peptidoglycan-binding domain-containing protein [Iocasia frigidifontis]|uniref:LysM peptidoglycan-binding domain-containing protein n=1 Tax=Iocasia fonsfrigidae TaxID=2682810 RepID=A0A8A7KDL4_9FIRM|nr:LysM peptidoglycan-binding domain-containing protein [Iocasia fonsfrigidae]QTL99511.1 LysM peptidoglycan-binding domain-containing protein [Iocasia fonsfrigidae]
MKRIIIISSMVLVLTISLFTMAIAAQNYTVKTGDTLWTISQKFGTTIETIINNNNLKNTNIYIGQTLKIGSTENNSNDIYYTVKQGDLLYKIAQRYNISVNELIRANNISSPYYIYIGQSLIIPGKQEKPAENNTDYNYSYYTIKQGDILWNIAQKYSTTVQRLVELNNIKDAYDLYIGRRLIVPVVNTTPEQEDSDNQNNNRSPYTFYRIKSGDQIQKIASYFGLTTSNLINYNNIDDINNITAGDLLIIPLRKSSKLNYLNQNSKNLNNHYRVKNNETLTEIANFFRIPEEGIRSINNMKENEQVYTGQRLQMPISSALFVNHKIYQVKAGGEYLHEIAFNHGVSIRSILRANYLTDENTIFDGGDIIIVPQDEDSKSVWVEYEDGKPVNSWF